MKRLSALLTIMGATALPSCVSIDDEMSTPTASAQDAEFVEALSRDTFDYFWDTTTTDTCLAPDRWPSNPFSSVAATGFAITAYAVGVERRYISRDQAVERTLRCMEFYHDAPQGPAASGTSGYQGFYYHFLKNSDGTRQGTSELSTVDTTLFLGGILFAQAYYDRDTVQERRIRSLAEAIYRRVNWQWAQEGATGTPEKDARNPGAIIMGWRPERGWGPGRWTGYNEGMLVYILAAASPTHPVSKAAWDQGWSGRMEKDWGTYYGQEHLQFEPLFGHQYSHVFVDFRGIQDAFMARKGIDYFENSRRATLAQRAYGIDNPNGWIGYSGDIWGWTASDGPGAAKGREVDGTERRFMAYAARGVSSERVVDDGTIVPTAAGGSIPFAPEVTIRALKAMKDRYGDRLYSRYGFKDSFNPSFIFVDAGSRTGEVDPVMGWVARDHIGIDQGPILAMLENHRSELIWRTMRNSAHVRNGLQTLGFSGGWLDK